ncbi:hypothetical protein KRX57_08615 [Weeksellaceae bacterium TAE3-ERU29]|nr:hypothetical protein [Weeksellaceae bacterium TAE3-ERU29]
MKKLIYFVLFTFIVVSCNSDDETTVNNFDVIGSWNWTSTKGGINGGNINETPTTTEKSIVLILTSSYDFSVTENGSQVSNGKYELKMEKSIYSGEMERFISFKTIDQRHVGFVQSGIINITQNGEMLKISDNNYDGVISLFEKIK